MLRFLLFALVSGVSAFAPISPRQQSTTALQVAIDTSDIKNGLTVELDGEPYKVCLQVVLEKYQCTKE